MTLPEAMMQATRLVQEIRGLDDNAAAVNLATALVKAAKPKESHIIDTDGVEKRVRTRGRVGTDSLAPLVNVHGCDRIYVEIG